MYKLNDWLKDCSPKIGRARTFSRGWFENESIWLHMSYKYLLELLRCGLYDEFFTDTRTMLVPFMDPVLYGRSILENSSFIASSVCPDPAARGRGFVARLSGTTAEFIQIWLNLTLGANPFTLDRNTVHFTPEPCLPAEWFTNKEQDIEYKGESIKVPSNAFACSFLGAGLLIYHNESRTNTYGENCVKPVAISLDGGNYKPLEQLSASEVDAIRSRETSLIQIKLQ
jgi:hypothetical protein